MNVPADKPARHSQPPFLWTLITSPAERKGLTQSAWKDIGKVFILAIVLDVVYQVIELGTVYPLQSVIVAIVIALLPYALLRGLVTRIARTFRGTSS